MTNTDKNDDQLVLDNCGLLSSDNVHTGLISGVTFTNKEVTYAVVDGLAVFEGCIVLGTAELMEATVTQLEYARSATPEGVVITGTRYRWPNAVVPYEVAPNLPDQHRVTDAIAHWEAKTKVRFVPRSSANAGQYPNYLYFRSASGCWSHAGMQGGRQGVGLANGCSTGNTIHEIGHALGLWHEQSRENRDNHLQIHYENIDRKKHHNFNQHISDGDDIGKHDFDSIMHYGAYAFSKNGKPTITTNPPGIRIGQRNGLSEGDVAAIEAIY